MKNILIFLSFLSVSAFAQTTYYYGPQGESQGTATRNGNTTYYYGPQGQSAGTAVQPSNGYQNNGGQIQSPSLNQIPVAPVQNYGNQPLPQPYRSPSNRSSY